MYSVELGYGSVVMPGMSVPILDYGDMSMEVVRYEDLFAAIRDGRVDSQDIINLYSSQGGVGMVGGGSLCGVKHPEFRGKLFGFRWSVGVVCLENRLVLNDGRYLVVRFTGSQVYVNGKRVSGVMSNQYFVVRFMGYVDSWYRMFVGANFSDEDRDGLEFVFGMDKVKCLVWGHGRLVSRVSYGYLDQEVSNKLFCKR